VLQPRPICRVSAGTGYWPGIGRPHREPRNGREAAELLCWSLSISALAGKVKEDTVKRKLLPITIVASSLLAAGTAWSYDKDLAASYAALFKPVAGATAAKELGLMAPDDYVQQIRSGKGLVTLDIRTPAESQFFAMAGPQSLVIPMDQLFTPDGLARIPADKPVVVLCKGGERAVAAGVALRHLGYKNVQVLKGGYQALATYLDPKVANEPVKEKTAMAVPPR
jgi:rhodanese-related sulfurtransferase